MSSIIPEGLPTTSKTKVLLRIIHSCHSDHFSPNLTLWLAQMPSHIILSWGNFPLNQPIWPGMSPNYALYASLFKFDHSKRCRGTVHCIANYRDGQSSTLSLRIKRPSNKYAILSLKRRNIHPIIRWPIEYSQLFAHRCSVSIPESGNRCWRSTTNLLVGKRYRLFQHTVGSYVFWLFGTF